MEKKPLSSSRAESEADRGRSQSHQTHVDSSNNRRGISPNSGSYVCTDNYRSKAISSRDATGLSKRNSNFRSTDKSNKVDDDHLGEISAERSSSSKASPMGLVDKSPSSTSSERRQIIRSGARRSLDRLNQDRPLEKPSGDDDDPSQADSSLHNKTGQNSSLIQDENRFNSSARYKRNGDPNSARGHGNAWRWSSQLVFTYAKGVHHAFPTRTPLGGFQPMMPQFLSPLFGARPPMDMNHPGIPYHIPDTDRFIGHLHHLTGRI